MSKPKPTSFTLRKKILEDKTFENVVEPTKFKIQEFLAKLELDEINELIILSSSTPDALNALIKSNIKTQTENEKSQQIIEAETQAYYDALLKLGFLSDDEKKILKLKAKSTNTLVEAFSGGGFAIDMGWFLSTIAVIATLLASSIIAAALTTSGILIIAALLFIIVYRVNAKEIQKDEENILQQCKLHNLKSLALDQKEKLLVNDIKATKDGIKKKYEDLIKGFQKKMDLRPTSKDKPNNIDFDKSNAQDLIGYLISMSRLSIQDDDLKKYKIANELFEKDKLLQDLIASIQMNQFSTDAAHAKFDNSENIIVENFNAPKKVSRPFFPLFKEKAIAFDHFIFRNIIITPGLVCVSIIGGLFFGLYSSVGSMLTMLHLVAAAAALTSPVGIGIALGISILIAAVCAIQNVRSIVSLQEREKALVNAAHLTMTQAQTVHQLEQEQSKLMLLEKYFNAHEANQISIKYELVLMGHNPIQKSEAPTQSLGENKNEGSHKARSVTFFQPSESSNKKFNGIKLSSSNAQLKDLKSGNYVISDHTKLTYHNPDRDSGITLKK